MFRWEKISNSATKPSGVVEAAVQQALPEQFSMATLEKNLAALAQVEADLCRRVCLPVDGSHVHFLQNGEACYQKHRTLLPLVVGEKDLAASIGNVEIPTDIFLFGIGLGEQLDYVLRHFKGARITVWDRDPWLVRLTLMQRDFSRHLLSGRLQLGMCIDLLDMVDTARGASLICHPFMKSFYENELKLLEEGLGEKRAIICSGELFVDDVMKVLRDRHYSVYTLEIKKLAIEEISETIKRFDPRFVFSVNYTNGLAEVCHKLEVSLVCWEIDPAADTLKPCKSPTEHSHIFTHCKTNIEKYIRSGFKNVLHMPLATDPEKRSAPQFSKSDEALYGSPLSFVGSSMIDQANSFRNVFLAHYKAYRGGSPQAVEEGNQILEEILLIQRQDFSMNRIPDLMQQHFSSFVDYLLALPNAHNPFMLVGEIAAAEKRVKYVAELGTLGIKVWGDNGWHLTKSYGVEYMGGAGHNYEINRIYFASVVNLDINRIYQPDVVTMRVYDIMACGGFVLAEHSRDLEELFEIGTEVETYRTKDELLEKAAYYLEHTDEAKAFAKKGQEVVYKNHTIAKRVERMLHVSGLDTRLSSRTT